MADDEDVGAALTGQQYAQNSPYQIRPLDNGQFQVLDIRTGQIHFVGTASGASNAQATLNYRAGRG